MGEMREWAEKSHTKKIDAMKGKLFISYNKTFPDMDDTFELTRNRGWTLHTRQKPLKLKRDFLFCSPVDAWLNYHFCTTTRALLSSTWNIQWDFFQSKVPINQSKWNFSRPEFSLKFSVCVLFVDDDANRPVPAIETVAKQQNEISFQNWHSARERAARGGGKHCQKMNVTFVWHANK